MVCSLLEAYRWELLILAKKFYEHLNPLLPPVLHAQLTFPSQQEGQNTQKRKFSNKKRLFCSEKLPEDGDLYLFIGT